MPGGLLTQVINQSYQKDFKDLLAGFGLADFYEDILQSYDEIGEGTLTKSALYSWYIGKGLVNQENVRSIFSQIEKGLQQLVASQPNNEVAPVNSPRDVSIRFESEDEIFHALLDFLKSLVLDADRERRVFNVFISHLKGLRDDLEAKDSLMRDPQRGGAGLSLDAADAAIKQFSQTHRELLEKEFTPEYATQWFKEHYDSIMLNQPVKAEIVEEIEIDSQKEATEGEHRLIEASHDMNMPFAQHISYHIQDVTEEKELPAPVKMQELSAIPEPVKISEQARKPNSAMAPLPARKPVIPAEQKTTAEMVSVEKKPMVAPVSDDLRAVRAIPPQIKQMIDQDAASAAGEAALRSSIAKPQKRGLFSRMFSKPQTQPVQAPQTPPVPINAIPTVGGRPQVLDIAYTPKLMTPVDELQSLSLADFRRLAKDPMIAIKKILDKLDLLGQESLKKKAEGIEALKKSALYRDYSAIMNESVMQGLSFAQVMERQKTLTEEEYKALMSLNKSLRS